MTDMNDLLHMQPESIFPFEQLYERYYWPLYRRVYRLLGHRERTEDVMQETFLKAFRASATIRPEGNVYAWLCRIAKNTAIDHRKPREQAICTSLDALSRELADHASTKATDLQTRNQNSEVNHDLCH
jgi:RNA polymerase sigma factor (sigma-70 family)